MALIRRYEGFSAEMYFCPAGRPTIGYGHVIRDSEWQLKAGITLKQAMGLLEGDVSDAERAVNRLVKVTLSQNQFDALAAFTYNIGAKAFEKSTLLRLLNEGNVDRAGQEFGRWVYANGRKLEGLVNRRVAEAALFKEKARIFV